MSPKRPREAGYSKNKIKKAGKRLREHHLRGAGPPPGEAVEILEHWRSCHSYPLSKATMGLRSMTKTAKCQDPRVSQRLKRRVTIIDKLAREPTMQLTTMQDIGGCRAVLADVDEIRCVEERWHKRDRVKRTDDYLVSPKDTGYRGLHLIVTYDDYLIEVQLRTQLEHAWAVGVERVGGALGHDLKSGLGPPEILRLFRAFGELLANAEGLEGQPDAFEEILEASGEVSDEVLRLLGLRIEEKSLVLENL